MKKQAWPTARSSAFAGAHSTCGARSALCVSGLNQKGKREGARHTEADEDTQTEEHQEEGAEEQEEEEEEEEEQGVRADGADVCALCNLE